MNIYDVPKFDTFYLENFHDKYELTQIKQIKIVFFQLFKQIV